MSVITEKQNEILFRNHPQFQELLTSMGFRPFEPHMVCVNGYSIGVPHSDRWVSFHDNRLYKRLKPVYEMIEFQVKESYFEHDYRRILGFKLWRTGELRGPYSRCIHREYFNSVTELTKEVIDQLIIKAKLLTSQHN